MARIPLPWDEQCEGNRLATTVKSMDVNRMNVISGVLKIRHAFATN